MHADVQYKFLDSAIKMLNNKVFTSSEGKTYRLKVHYSTLDQYFTDLKQETETKRIKWPVFKGDFLPYNAAQYYPGDSE